MTAVRIQRRRTKGWRMPEGAVYVGRPSRWGNPFTVGAAVREPGFWKAPCAHPVSAYELLGAHRSFDIANQPYDYVVRVVRDRADAVELFRRYVEFEDAAWAPDRLRAHLAGRDLACWCPLEDAQGNRVPCHADVLLEIANSEVAP